MITCRVDPASVAGAFRRLNYLPHQGVWFDTADVRFRGEPGFTRRCRACGLAALWVEWHMAREFPPHWWGHEDRRGAAEGELRGDRGGQWLGWQMGFDLGYVRGFVCGWDCGYVSDTSSARGLEGLADGRAAWLAARLLLPSVANLANLSPSQETPT